LKKLEKMKEMTNYYYETGSFMEVEPEEDPFYGKPKPSKIGQGYYALKPLAFLIDNPCSIPIIIQGGKAKAKLEVNIVPCDSTGDPDGISEEMFTDNPDDLKGHRLDFIVEISHATDVPQDACKDLFVQYQFYLEDQFHTTQIVQGNNSSPVFNYRKQHTIEYVSDGFLQYLDKEQVSLVSHISFLSTCLESSTLTHERRRSLMSQP
jgi:hypothetical protein